MALLTVLRFPDENLRIKAKPVTSVDDSIRVMVDDMLETMYQEKGVGLAAIQVDIHLRIVVIDVSEEGNSPLVLINPEITHKEGSQLNEEGCLSVPGCYAQVERAEKITFKALDREGNAYEKEADGLLAICVQHELDHLDGKLFVDYLSPLKRERIKKRLEKEARLASRRL